MIEDFGRTHEQSWKNVGDFHRRAILDVANILGGVPLVEEIKKLISDPEEILPITALRYITTRYPDSGDRIMDRAEHIQRLKHREDWIRLQTFRQPRSSEALWINYGENRRGIKGIYDTVRRNVVTRFNLPLL